MRTRTWYGKCLTILKQCTREDLNKMKGWLQGALPDSKLQKVQEPYQLFSLMVEAKLLSPDKLYHLATPLSSAGRQDLRQQLEDWDSFEQKCLSILKQCSRKHFNVMKFLLTDVIPGVKLENVQDPYEWFSRMVDAELLSPDNLYFLATLLSTDGREDLKRELLKDQQFGEQVLYEELAKDDANYLVTSGYFLIICNETRDFHVSFVLERTFKRKFGFNTHEHDDLTKSEMLKLLKETAEQDFSSYPCFVCVIQGYGSAKDGIYGKDDEVISLDAITSLFSQNKCPSLKGKPKIFLIEAFPKGDKVSGSDPSSSPTVSEADFLINYATPERKKWYLPFGFMSAVQHVFEVYSEKEDLINMMIRVNNLTTKSYSASKMQSPTLISTLTKKVFFKPRQPGLFPYFW